MEVSYLWRPPLKHAEDEMVLEAAVNGQAGIIVTFNVSDFLPSALKQSVEEVAQDDGASINQFMEIQ